MPSNNNKCFKIVIFVIALLCSISTLFAQEKTLKVGYFSFNGYHEEEQNIKSGYGYEYLQYISRYTDWIFDYVGYDKSWSTMLVMLENGEIDILTSAQKTKERLEKFDFSEEPIGISSTILTTKAGNLKYNIDNYSELDGIKVGMLRGNSRNNSFESFSKENNFTYEAFYFETEPELLNALQNNDKIEAVVTSNLRATQDEWIIAQFDSSPFYVIVKKGNKALMDKVNYAIKQIEINNPKLQSELFSKYYSNVSSSSVGYTKNEKATIERISKARTLTAIVEPNKKPLSYYENKEAKGVISEIAKLIIEKSGLSIDFIYAKTKEEYNDIIAQKKVDLIFDFDKHFSNAENLGYKLSDSFLSIPYVEVFLSGNNFKLHNERVAAYKNSLITNDYIEKQYPKERITYYDNYNDCINAILNKKQDVFYTDAFQASYQVYVDETNKLSSTSYDYFSDIPIKIAIRNDIDFEILPLLNKAIHNISQNTINSIIQEQTYYPKHKFSVYGYLYDQPIVIIIIVILLAIIIYTLITINSKNKYTKAIQKQSDEFFNFIKYVCKSNDYIFETDKNKKTRIQYSIKDGSLHKEISAYDYENFYKSIIKKEDLEIIEKHCSLEAQKNLIEKQGDDTFDCRIRKNLDPQCSEYNWYRCTQQGMKKDENRPCSMMLYVKNINVNKNEEENKRNILQEALGVAEHANTAKSIFTSRMSHEIRTPLNAVIGYLSIASDNINKIEKVEDCITKSSIAAKHLLHIINDVLDLSSIENGKINLVSERFDLKALISSLTDLFYTQCKTKGINFEVIVNNMTEEWVVGDQMRIKQVLINLLGNAVKFTPEGKSIFFTITQLQSKKGIVPISFSVKDTGIGISEEFKKRLFNPFEQQDSTTFQNYGGTGLGLSISKNLVTLMKGSIKVDSVEGEGSNFIVEIPFKKDIVLKEYKNNRDFSNVHALIVDDEANTCEYISMLMARCGVKSDVVMSGKDALLAIQKGKDENNNYDLCLMDWKMPDMDGIETIKAIRKIVGNEVPIIIVTSYDFSEIRDSAKEVGVDLFISKPLFQSTVFNLLVNTYDNYHPKIENKKDTNRFLGKHLLLVEDNKMNMEIAEEILEQAGFIVDRAFNGQEAITKFIASKENTYDAILMDIMMPILNGHEATKIIRTSNHPRAKTIPIIAMTANAFTEDVSAALQAGMTDHIAKPIDLNQLFLTLSEYIDTTE